METGNETERNPQSSPPADYMSTTLDAASFTMSSNDQSSLPAGISKGTTTKPEEGDFPKHRQAETNGVSSHEPNVTDRPVKRKNSGHVDERTSSPDDVERQSSKLQAETRGLPGTETHTTSARNSTCLAREPAEKNISNREDQNQTRATSIKMEDDSSAIQSTSSPPLKDPDGALPNHRHCNSRRYSEDLEEVSKGLSTLNDGNELFEDETDTNPNEATATESQSSSSFAHAAIREIEISQSVPSISEDENDDVSGPTSSPPLGETFPQESSQGSEPKLKQQQETGASISNLNDSMDDPMTPYSMPYRLEPSSHPKEIINQESDVSVFSIHSGYAMADQSNLPRIMTGAIVQSSPAIHQPPFSSGVSSMVQPVPTIPNPQHSMAVGSNGYSPFPPQTIPQIHHYGAPAPMPSQTMPPPIIMGPPSIGKRKIHLRLMEDITSSTPKQGNARSGFLSFRRTSSNRSFATPSPVIEDQEMDRGKVTVSWYEGTTTLELMEHVRNSITRKLGLEGTIKLGNLRVLDESSDPPEEIVLSPYIPSGSRLLVRFSTRDAGGDMTPPYLRRPSYTGGAPESPSAAPSPHANALDLQGLGLNANQLALLGSRLKGLQMPSIDSDENKDGGTKSSKKRSSRLLSPRRTKLPSSRSKSPPPKDDRTLKEDETQSRDDQSSVFEMNSLHPEDQIQKSLQNITELLMIDRQKIRYVPRQDKKHVVFVLANYFVLFLSLIAISAELQARAPGWNAAIESHLNNVKNCSKDQDTLFECVSNGDMAGLVASVILWISRSAATKRIFLFGFDSPRKLWTVVYESLVTAVCWGFSYMFIRRGMNPDTNRNFLQKYWKDAVYGSLAGFNAAFLKQILKNLIPQEAIEDALQERQLKILSWLPSLHH